MKGHIIYGAHDTIENQTYIQLFGRLENNKSFAIINQVEPYFFIKKKDLVKAKPLLIDCTILETTDKNGEDEGVVKILNKNYQNIQKIAKEIHKAEINTYESDINPFMRYMIDNDIYTTIEINGDSEPSERVDYVYREAIIKPVSVVIPLKLLSIDIETSKKGGELFCIGQYSENYQKNFVISNTPVDGAIACKTEQELLQKWKTELLSFDPDIITGWHVIDFDFDFLRKKCEENNIPLDIGRTNENVKIRKEGNFFRSSSMQITGRQVLDGLSLIKDPFIQEAPSIKNKKFESYTLESVSQEMLGEGKLIKGKERHDEIEKLFNTNKKKMVEYNIQDCKLVYDILTKSKILNLAIERTSLTGLTLNRLTASIAAFDSLYIRAARKVGLVSPTTRYVEKEERIKGGFVMEPKPGIYHNVLVLDFKSLYPSIIKTFNIDPLSLLDKKTEGAIESPNKAYFKNTKGLLPIIIETLHKERERAKKEKRELSSYAIKVIMNSFFGVLASPNCRYFSLKMANAITHFGQMIIQLTAKKIEEQGHKVIYSDTDSVFVETNKGKISANKLGPEIQDYINSFYKEFVKKEYRRESFLELEFEKQYLSIMLPAIRNKEVETGSKKRYAGLIEKNNKEELEIVGLEAIRGDWTNAAKDFQIELLTKIFHKEDPLPFIKKYVEKINAGKMDEKLIYRKSIRKDLIDYTKTTPPHVKAARKLDKLDSTIIEYYITLDGPEPIQKLKHKIDYEHYIKKQISPIANTILYFFNTNIEDILKNSKQAKLF